AFDLNGHNLPLIIRHRLATSPIQDSADSTRKVVSAGPNAPPRRARGRQSINARAAVRTLN
ncbi:MAG: hypothetical protein LAQ69_29260, partial [Acidobacteriia bacterium]|nr:hypothetical protein [Terriglobia bacterium]